MEQTDKEPHWFAFVALSGLGRLKAHRGGKLMCVCVCVRVCERSSVSHLGDCGESVSHQISRSFTRVGGFISLLCNNTRWLPSCFTVIYNSSPLEFAEIPKATAQIR